METLAQWYFYGPGCLLATLLAPAVGYMLGRYNARKTGITLAGMWLAGLWWLHYYLA